MFAWSLWQSNKRSFQGQLHHYRGTEMHIIDHSNCYSSWSDLLSWDVMYMEVSLTASCSLKIFCSAVVPTVQILLFKNRLIDKYIILTQAVSFSLLPLVWTFWSFPGFWMDGIRICVYLCTRTWSVPSLGTSDIYIPLSQEVCKISNHLFYYNFLQNFLG